MGSALFDIGHYLLTILSWVIIIQIILNWLVVLNVINFHSQGVRTFVNALDRVTAPLYRPGGCCPTSAGSTSRPWSF